MEVGEPSGFSSVSRRRTAVERSSKVSRQAAEEETLTGGRKEIRKSEKRGGRRKRRDEQERAWSTLEQDWMSIMLSLREGGSSMFPRAE